MRITDLRVQALKAPLGINRERLVLGYRLQSEKNGDFQSARRIQAASSEKLLLDGTADLWDSQKVEDAQCFGIVYKGQKLSSRQNVYWRVKVWDSDGAESDWSEPAMFEIGLGASDWKGIWIGQGEEVREEQSSAPVFAGKFQVEDLQMIRRARAYISGLGLYRASLNGHPLSDCFFEPGESDATKSVYYGTYDILEDLKQGENVLAVTLGNGQYTGYTIDPVMLLPDGSRAPAGRYQKNDSMFVKPGICGKKKLLAQVELTMLDGRVQIACATDERWYFRDSPTVFQNWYGGEDYDALMEADIQLPLLQNQSGWKQAKQMKAPAGALVCRECPPIRVKESTPAKQIIRLGEGHFLADMGKNGAGIPELRLSDTSERERGNWVYLFPAESLKENGDGVDQRSCTQSWSEEYDCVIRDSYRIKGTGEERWHPSFCYHGFRYVEVTGFPGEMKPEHLICHRLYADNERPGIFHSSNEIVNRICEITDRSIESNMYWSFTDCPQIEKLGWAETSHLMFQSVASVFDIRAWMKKILRDIRDSVVDQGEALLPGNEEEGFVPGIIPEYYRIRGLYRDPNWNGACVFTPWEYYQCYGEIAVLEDAFPVMERYLAYLETKADGHVLDHYAQMGEWGEYGEHTPKVLVATAAYYRMLKIAADTASLLQKPDAGRYYRERAEAVRRAFFRHPACYDPESDQIGSGSQASYGCALFSGLLQGRQKADAVERLAETVRKNEFHLTSGEVGLRQVFAALAENGRSDVVYRMVMNQTPPSYRFFVDQGLTTLPEYWDYEELWNGMVRSRNHAMMGHVREWLTRYVLGVRPLEPGWRRVQIAPYLPPDMEWAEGSVFTPFGVIQVSWKKENSSLYLEAELPVGICGELTFPTVYGGKTVGVTSGKQAVSAKMQEAAAHV